MKTYDINASAMKPHEKLNLKTVLRSLLKDGLGHGRETVDENAIRMIFAMHQQAANTLADLPVDDPAHNYFHAEEQLTSRAVDLILKMEDEAAWKSEMCVNLNVSQFQNPEIQGVLDTYKCPYLGDRVFLIGHLKEDEISEFTYFMREAFSRSGPMVTLSKTAATGIPLTKSYLRDIYSSIKLRRPMSEELTGPKT